MSKPKIKLRRFTVRDVMGHMPCDDYPLSRVKALFGRRKYATLADLFRLSIPAEDKLWLADRVDPDAEFNLGCLWVGTREYRAVVTGWLNEYRRAKARFYARTLRALTKRPR